jgi:phosphoribosylanthranilate isomerase
VQVKICGLTTPEMVDDAVAAGADAIGLVLTRSPRRIDVDTAAVLLARVPADVQSWAVFRTPEPEILDAIATLPFTGVQADASWSGEGLPEGFAFLPAFKDGEDLADRVGSLGRTGPARGLIGAVLVDGPRGGGLGERAQWARCAEVARLGPMVLAGGLDPANVGEAIVRVAPWGVDVSSGVEAAPGRKDPAQVTAFVAAARNA